jgi:C-terminal processing protease CtpA/Prc
MTSFVSFFMNLLTNRLSNCLFQRCVVVQEVFPEGLIAADGRLQPGDQIIEINGVDMTCASHAQVTHSTF